MDNIRRLIIEEVDHTPSAKIYAISVATSKTFLAKHLFNDYNNGIVELVNNEQFEHIQDKFCEWSFPNVYNLIASFKHCLRGGYIDSILELKSKSHYDYI